MQSEIKQSVKLKKMTKK